MPESKEKNSTRGVGVGRWIIIITTSNQAWRRVTSSKMKSGRSTTKVHLNWVQISKDEEHHTALLNYGGGHLKLSWREKRCDLSFLHECAQSRSGWSLENQTKREVRLVLGTSVELSVRYHTDKCTDLIMEKGGIFLAQQGASQ